MLQYQTVPVTAFQQNCSIVWCDETMKAAVIDPGGDLDLLLAEVKRQGLTLEQIWLTHAHIDHAGGTAELAKELDLPIIGPHPGDQFWIDSLPEQGQRFGLPRSEAFTPTRWLHDGDTVSIGHSTLKVRHCPGHTPGHVVFHSPEIGRAFVGDVLFAGSIGRTDLPCVYADVGEFEDHEFLLNGSDPSLALRTRRRVDTAMAQPAHAQAMPAHPEQAGVSDDAPEAVPNPSPPPQPAGNTQI